jgi:flagellar basal-body rod modification protein FlgD
MTTIAPISTAPATQSAASKTLAGNFNTFLTLLTTQLQNQDPLNPMDSNQFTQQLVEFSQVEQQINTNDNLKTLISLGQGRSTSDAVGYLGRAVTVSNGKGALIGGAANWNYVLGANAANTQITVTDASGRVVYTGAGETEAGQHSFTWDGKDNAGNQLADGAYQMTLNATGADGSAVRTAIASSGIVTEVDLSGSEPMLMLGPLPIKVSEVTSVAGY